MGGRWRGKPGWSSRRGGGGGGKEGLWVQDRTLAPRGDTEQIMGQRAGLACEPPRSRRGELDLGQGVGP